MHYMNEDAAWQRFQDLQREMENRRLLAAGRPSVTLETLRRLGARAWLWRAAMRRSTTIRRDGEHRPPLVFFVARRPSTATCSPSPPPPAPRTPPLNLT